MPEHKCLHEADWGSVKTNVTNILKTIREIKNATPNCPHTKEVARMQVYIYVMWAGMGGMFIWNLRLHGLW